MLRVGAPTHMPQRESEAIILRTYSLGEADRLVSFLTRKWGRMRGVAARARSPKSRFGATLEPLSHIRVWFFERETRELVRISQTEMLDSFLDVQSDYECNVALAMIAEITEAVLPDREASDPAFRLVLAAVKSIRQTRRGDLPLLYFALWTVRLGGWLPSLERCGKCGRELAAIGAFVSPTHHRPLCGECRLPGMRALSPNSVALARNMLTEKLEVLVEKAGVAGKGRDLMAYLLDVIEQQIERKLTTRRMLESNA